MVTSSLTFGQNPNMHVIEDVRGSDRSGDSQRFETFWKWRRVQGIVQNGLF